MKTSAKRQETFGSPLNLHTSRANASFKLAAAFSHPDSDAAPPGRSHGGHMTRRPLLPGRRSSCSTCPMPSRSLLHTAGPRPSYFLLSDSDVTQPHAQRQKTQNKKETRQYLSFRSSTHNHDIMPSHHAGGRWCLLVEEQLVRGQHAPHHAPVLPLLFPAVTDLRHAQVFASQLKSQWCTLRILGRHASYSRPSTHHLLFSSSNDTDHNNQHLNKDRDKDDQ